MTKTNNPQPPPQEGPWSGWIVGIRDRALVGLQRRRMGDSTLDRFYLELVPPEEKTSAMSTTTSTVDPKDTQHDTSKTFDKPGEEDDDEPAHDPAVQVQAVTACWESTNSNGGWLWMAVALSNKLLLIYRVTLEEVGIWLREFSSTPSRRRRSRIRPTTVHETAKRISSMCFAPLSSSSLVLVCGDLVGDATAYALLKPTNAAADFAVSSTMKNDNANNNNNNPHHAITTIRKESEQEATACPYRKVLLGHTASMLTALAVAPASTQQQQQWLLTADRDEIIRVSSFPMTSCLHGYLLGHTAFVTDVASLSSVSSPPQKDDAVVSCGGDGTVRVWDTQTCQLCTTLELKAHYQEHIVPLLPQTPPTSQDLEEEEETPSNQWSTDCLPMKLALVPLPSQYASEPQDQSSSLDSCHVLALIYDNCPVVDLWKMERPARHTTNNDDDMATNHPVEFCHWHTLVFPTCPLAVAPSISSSSANGEICMVLVRDSQFLLSCLLPPSSTTTNNSSQSDTILGPTTQCICSFADLQEETVPGEQQPEQQEPSLGDLSPDRAFPRHVLERDRFGRVAMTKNLETRGPALRESQASSWNNAKRKDVARLKNQRLRKSRTKKKQKRDHATTTTTEQQDTAATTTKDDDNDESKQEAS